MNREYHIETKCIQSGWKPKKGEPRMMPIYQSTTFKYDTTEEMGRLFDLKDNGYFYTRCQNPTNDLVAAKIAAASEIPNFIAFFIQSKRLVAEPAKVPSASAAKWSFIVTSCPPSSYLPFGMPVAIMESLIRTTLSSPNILKVVRIVDG